MCDISVIVPLYYGEKYIDGILEMVRENLKQLNDTTKIEIIFVKDSPEKFEKQHPFCENVRLIENKENLGIHGSRLQGLINANGKFVHMLDQDDAITSDFYRTQLCCLKECDDVVVANGIKEYQGYDKYLYKWRLMHETVKIEWFYLFFSCRILSPGQCLIRTECIPQRWKENCLKNNGADDFFLWLLLFEQKAKFAINRNAVYRHNNTGENLSLYQDKMDNSLQEVVDLVERYQCIGKRKINLIKKRQLSSRGKIGHWIISLVESINRQ